VAFLARRAAAPDRVAIAALAVEEAGAIRADELALQLGPAVGPAHVDGWLIDPSVEHTASHALVALLRATHEARPLDEGAPLADIRAACTAACRGAHAPTDPALIEALLARLSADGTIARDGMTVRLPTHQVALTGHEPDVQRLVSAISGAQEATPPTVKELVADGVDPSLIDAAARAGSIVRISPELVLSRALVTRATELVRAHPTDGITVSALREHLGTSRKYAVPLAEWMDANGISRRVGDLRFPRDAS
jgi:selenocysteine-specific elongation factor